VIAGPTLGKIAALGEMGSKFAFEKGMMLTEGNPEESC
jgi:hypothetical protein